MSHATSTMSHAGTPTGGTFRAVAAVIFIFAGLLVLPVGAASGPYRTLSIMFTSIVLEALPFMLLGALVGGLIEAFVSRERMASLLPKRGLTAICVATGLGIVFPVCECAVVPVVRRLLGKGLPFGAGIAYLLAGPIVNPIVAASTALAYGFEWKIMAMRLGLGYAVAVTAALVLNRLFPGKSALHDGLEHIAPQPCSCGCEAPLQHFSQVTNAVVRPSFASRLGQALRHGTADFLGVAQYLIVGAFVAAVAQAFVDRSLLLGLASLPSLSILAMTALAVALNLCSESDAFIAASFSGLMPPAAQMAFMLTGPMFDLKLLLMYQAVFRKRVIAVLAGLVLLLTVGASMSLLVLEGWS